MSGRIAGFLSMVLPGIVYAALLFWISSMAQPNAPDYGLEWGDKINHAGAFGLMALLWFRASGWFRPRREKRARLIIVVLLVALYGASDEIHQSFVPGRFADITDWLADVAGALVATGVIAMLPEGSSIHRRLFGSRSDGDEPFRA